MSHRFVRPRPEVAGAVLLLGLCGWVLLAGLHGHASPYPVLFAVATLAGAYVAGRAAGRHAALVAVPAAVLVAVALARTGDPRQAGPLAPPLGYANADAALAVQAAALAGLAAARLRRGPIVAVLVAAAGGFVLYAGLLRSAAGAATGVLVLAAALAVLVRRPRGTRTVRAVAAGCALAAVGVTIAAGLAHDVDAVRTHAERRADLWHDAVAISADHPVTGVGPGRFARASPTAAGDADTRAAHSAVLEQAAETGLPGALLLVLLALWALGRAGAGPDADHGTAVVAIAAWTALALHSAVDYVADFPAVLVAAGLVTGLGTASSAGSRVTAPGAAAGSPGSRHRRR